VFDLKRLLLIGAFVLSAIAIGTGLYFAFFRAVVTEPSQPAAVTRPGAAGLPAAGEGAPTPFVPARRETLPQADAVAGGGVTRAIALSASSVGAVSPTPSGANYYDPGDGRFYGVDKDGNVTALSAAQFPSASDVEWSPLSDKAIVEFPDGSNVVYDFATQTQVTLPSHWEDFAFTPSGEEIVAKSIGLDPNNRWLVVSNADGSNVKSVQPLGFNASLVKVAPSPNDQIVAFADTAAPLQGGLDRKMIVPIGRNQENFRGLAIEGLGFTPKWSPDGSKLLYSAAGDYSANEPLLWIVDASPATLGENRRSLGINTWADKCAFHGTQALYCAVPRGLPANAGLQRAIADGVPDDLYRVDLVTGEAALAAIPDADMRMDDLMVAADGSSVFFTDAFTGKLQTIRLK